MQLKLFVDSARNLKHVNWRSGHLQPYAVIWIDSGGKRSTKVDENHGIHPVWKEMFTIPLPSKTKPETAILYIEIVHAETKQIIGSTNLPLRVILDEALSKGIKSYSLDLERPSGRCQGSLEIQIQIEINGSTTTNKKEPCGQQARNMSHQPQLQPQPLPPQQMNQYPNMPATIKPRYLVNSPQNIRPTLVQQPQNFMFMPSMRPQYRPIFQQPPIAPLNRFILHAGRTHAENMMMQSFQQMQPVSAFQGTDQGDTGMFNDTGVLGIDNSTYGASDYTGTSADGQLDTNGGFGDSGLNISGYDIGGFGSSGFDFGGLGSGGFDFGGLGSGGFDFGGFDF